MESFMIVLVIYIALGVFAYNSATVCLPQKYAFGKSKMFFYSLFFGFFWIFAVITVLFYKTLDNIDFGEEK